MDYTFGALPKKVDLRDYKIASAMQREFPEEFELKCCEVKDQGAIGSCTAHVAAEIEEYFDIIQNNDYKPLSVGYVYGTRYNHKGRGLALRDALKTLKDKGICYYSDFPYNKEVPEIIDLLNEANIDPSLPAKHKITSYYSIDCNDANQIKNALMEHGPVMVCVKWYRDIKIKDDIIRSSQTGDHGWHCILLYGWNKDGWKIMNSWGAGWANDGKAIWPYDMKLEEAWGATDTETDDIIKPKRNSFIDVLYKVVNCVINIFISAFESMKK